VRLARLIDNVLDFAKIERGVDVYEFADGDVGEVVARRGRAVDPPPGQRADDDRLDVPPDLPAVRLDGNALTLAVLNLIDNAIKYAADGKRIEVKVGGPAARRSRSRCATSAPASTRRARPHLRALLPRQGGAAAADPRLGHRPGAGRAHRPGPRRQGRP
jgi:hypothetical protein